MENILLYGTIILAFIVIILAIIVFKINKRLTRLSIGKSTQSLESVIIENNELVKKTKQQQEDNINKIIHLESELAKSIQNISVVRFDALGDSGGQKSFAIGLTDSHKNGIVISSMYTRGSMNVFAKKIEKGESVQKLTDEEKQAINL